MPHFFTRRGPESLSNTITASDQRRPAVAKLSSGYFIVVWEDDSRSADDNSLTAIRAQLFDSNGVPVGAEFRVNSAVAGTQGLPRVAALSGGGFVVTWEDFSQTEPDTSLSAVRGQIYDAAAGPVGGELLLNSTFSGYQFNASVSQLPGGGFVAVWTQAESRITAPNSIKAQLFDASGGKVGNEFTVNTVALDRQLTPFVATLSDGKFVVVWTDDTFNSVGDGSGDAVKAQMFDSSGNRIGVEFLVNSDPSGSQQARSVAALASGGFVVVWTDPSDGGGRGVEGQVFDADGRKVGSEFLVNSVTADIQTEPIVTAMPFGGFVVSWTDYSNRGPLLVWSALKGQAFDETGQRIAGEFTISSFDSAHDQPAVAALDGNRFVAVWHGGSGGNSGQYFPGDIRTQIFAPADDVILGTPGADRLVGDSRGELLVGGAGDDFFVLQAGGEDNVSGGSGNDAFYFGAQLSSGDNGDGGTGKDVVALQGNYAALTLVAGNLVNVETLSLLTGADTRFGDTANNRYSYNLATVDANVAAGDQLIVNASTLRAGENLTFNGSAETNGSFLIYGGMGTDVLTGGAGADVFFFAEGRFNSGADRIDGGGGADIVALRGDATLTFAADAFTGIETISLISAADTRFFSGGERHNYNLTTNDGNVAAGATLTINGGQLRGGETLRFDGSAETNGAFRIFGGADVDVLIGGGGADLLYGGLGGDELRGGLGNDVFRYQSVAESNAAGGRDRILDFTRGDLMDLSRIDAIAGTPENDTFRFIGNEAFSGAAGELRVGFNSDGTRAVMGDIDGDRVADFEITVFLNAPSLTPSDFIL